MKGTQRMRGEKPGGDASPRALYTSECVALERGAVSKLPVGPDERALGKSRDVTPHSSLVGSDERFRS